MIFGKPARRRISKSLLSKSPELFVIRSKVVIMSVRVQWDENLIKMWAALASFRVLIILKNVCAGIVFIT